MGDTIIDEIAQTITFTGVDITFPFGFDVQTKTGTIMITGAQGLSNIAFNVQGQSGLPANINVIGHEVPNGDALPNPNPVKTVVNPGGPGVAAEYQYDLYYHAGPAGAAGAFALLNATDFAGPVGDGYTFTKTPGAPTVTAVPLPIGELYWPGSISSTAWSNTTPRLLCSVSVPAKPYAWRPIVHGSCVVTGSVDTRVDLIARLGNPDSGQEVGRGYGIAGTTPPPVRLDSGPPAGSASTYGRVAAGEAATIYLRAEQQAASSNNWSTAAGSTRFAVQVVTVL